MSYFLVVMLSQSESFDQFSVFCPACSGIFSESVRYILRAYYGRDTNSVAGIMDEENALKIWSSEWHDNQSLNVIAYIWG